MNIISVATVVVSVVLAASLVGCRQEGTQAPASAQLIPLERAVVSVEKSLRGVVVPVSIVTEKAGYPMVYVLQDNRARTRIVRLANAREGRVEVVAGLSGNERLVTGPFQELYDGALISVSESR